MEVSEDVYSYSTASEPENGVDANDLNTGQVAPSQPMKQWTVEVVASEMSKLLDSAIAAKFVEQQIDGRSLGLLTTDLLVTHMGLALGQALKVVDFVKSVQSLQKRQQSSDGA
ncbi:hypothetical protein KIN20_037503 [Parelaphostrongylus tenuis]|uniref:Uncharacterized protein n=1 Tax=Parelaphostrongylus tenuis TaxID=148309 RepID=A0AAD5RE18_PARTN|nr:hypothetical protein KIN20_037503 [Parelaphostrongylus tenuis]